MPDIAESLFIKTNKIIYSHNCINLGSCFTKHDALVSDQAIQTIMKMAKPFKQFMKFVLHSLLNIQKKASSKPRHRCFEIQKINSHLTSLVSQEQIIFWLPALYLWQILAKETMVLLCPCSSQHQPGPGSCDLSMQPPPVAFSYKHSQQTAQQIYLWRHFISLVLRIHSSTCIVHHSLLQEAFFILHLK